MGAGQYRFGTKRGGTLVALLNVGRTWEREIWQHHLLRIAHLRSRLRVWAMRRSCGSMSRSPVKLRKALNVMVSEMSSTHPMMVWADIQQTKGKIESRRTMKTLIL